jgi:multiple sugar transport system permease protein
VTCDGLFALVFLFPLYWMVTGGLKSAQESSRPADAGPAASAPGTTPPPGPSRPRPAAVQHRVYAFGALAFQLVFDVAAAYAFQAAARVLGNVVLFAMLATLMIPATVLVVPPT